MANERFMFGPSDKAETIYTAYMGKSSLDRNKSINAIIERYALLNSENEFLKKQLETEKNNLQNAISEVHLRDQKLSILEETRKAAMDYLGFKDIILEATEIRTQKIINNVIELMEKNQPQKPENLSQKKPGRPKKPA